MRYLFIVLRVAVAVLILAAVVGQLMTSAKFWQAHGVKHLEVTITNFFSFFTVESNILAAIVLLIGAYLLITRTTPDPTWFTVTRASVVTYMVVTGIVYNLLLRGIALPQGTTLPWSNEVVHLIAPIYLLLDWLFAPRRSPLPYQRIWIVIIFPLAWVIYTLVRAPLVTDEIQRRAYWYPYPFLNPHTSQNGYLSVSFYVLLIAAVVGLVGAGVIWVSRRRSLTRG
ncbi:MAG: hypothetical protein JWR53_1609 [Glaciihabitans sp.]|nr:hypothetical protein [Glaciihabitans sp.]